MLNNKAKESPLYERVVGGVFEGSWGDFLRAHTADAFAVFYYTDAEVRSLRLAPYVKACDARVAPLATPREALAAADQARSRRQREAEARLKAFVADAVRGGPVAQKELLRQLRGCPEFAAPLHPTLPLLLRFLARHRDVFVWTSDPDQPTRIGLLSAGRYPHHETPDLFAPRPRRNKRLPAPPTRPAALTPTPQAWPCPAPSPIPWGVWPPPMDGWGAPPAAVAGGEGGCGLADRALPWGVWDGSATYRHDPYLAAGA
eukprot:Sspe_Gene.48025::Locus_24745_Transcript_1_1_Confidence_1.000_Length_1746::g.48025::m.48025